MRFESFNIRNEASTAVLAWTVNSLFGSAQLYRTGKLGQPWVLLGSFPGVSGYEEAISHSIKSAFFRLAVPLP